MSSKPAFLNGLYEMCVSHGHCKVNEILRKPFLERGLTDPVCPHVKGLEKLGDTGDRNLHHMVYYRLPSGDVLFTCPGIVCTLFTSDRELYLEFARLMVAAYINSDHPAYVQGRAKFAAVIRELTSHV